MKKSLIFIQGSAPVVHPALAKSTDIPAEANETPTAALSRKGSPNQSTPPQIQGVIRSKGIININISNDITTGNRIVNIKRLMD